MKKIINNLKKIPTLLMLVLSVVMTVPANVFADETYHDLTEGMTRNLTVSGLDTKYAETVNVYKVMDVTVKGNTPVSPAYVWTDSVGKWIYDTYTTEVEKEDGTKETVHTYAELVDGKYAVTKAFTDLESNGSKIADFYDALAAYIKAQGIQPTKSITNSSKAASVTFEELALGNYFVLVESGSRVYRPTSVNVVPEFKDGKWVVKDNNTTNVSVKSSEPTIDKTVKVNNEDKEKTDVKIGDELNYTIEVVVPNYPANAKAKKIVISDTFGKGLTFNKNVKVYGVTETVGTDGKTVESEELLTLNTNYKYTANGDTGFTVTIDKTTDENGNVTDLYETVRKYSKIRVKYTGTVNSEAEVTAGAKNNATLQYNNNPYDDALCDPKTDDVTVYTYGFDLKKIDKDTKAALAGAFFEVKDSTGKVLKFTGSKGNYIFAEDGTISELEVAADGTLKVSGLKLGTYTLTETKAPDGYSKLATPITITLEDENLDGKEDKNATGYFKSDVENSQVYTLPVTGGIGTILFSVIGILFMGLGAFLIKNILKKEDVQ